MGDNDFVFHVQDDDSPAYVIASDMPAALEKWRTWVRAENAEDPLEEPIIPAGIQRLNTHWEPLLR